VSSLEENNASPSRELYNHYKAQLLQRVDEAYIEEEEAKYKQTLAEFAPSN